MSLATIEVGYTIIKGDSTQVEEKVQRILEMQNGWSLRGDLYVLPPTQNGVQVAQALVQTIKVD